MLMILSNTQVRFLKKNSIKPYACQVPLFQVQYNWLVDSDRQLDFLEMLAGNLLRWPVTEQMGRKKKILMLRGIQTSHGTNEVSAALGICIMKCLHFLDKFWRLLPQFLVPSPLKSLKLSQAEFFHSFEMSDSSCQN